MILHILETLSVAALHPLLASLSLNLVLGLVKVLTSAQLMDALLQLQPLQCTEMHFQLCSPQNFDYNLGEGCPLTSIQILVEVLCFKFNAHHFKSFDVR